MSGTSLWWSIGQARLFEMLLNQPDCQAISLHLMCMEWKRTITPNQSDSNWSDDDRRLVCLNLYLTSNFSLSLSPRSTGAIADTSKLSRLPPSSKKCYGPVIHKMHFWLSTWGPLYLTWDKENDELGSETRQSGGSWSKGLSIPAHVFHFQARAVPTIWCTRADGKSYEDAQTGRYEGLV